MTIMRRMGNLGSRRSATVLLVAVAMLLAACSSTPAAPAGGSGGGPTAAGAAGGGGGGGSTANFCALLSGAEVTQVVGKPLASTEPGSGGGRDCTWTFGTLTSTLIDFGGTVNLRTEGDASFRGPKIAFPGGADLSGIGDRAYWVDSFSVLYFAKGNTAYAVQLVLFDKTAPRQDIATKIAQLVLSKV